MKVMMSPSELLLYYPDVKWRAPSPKEDAELLAEIKEKGILTPVVLDLYINRNGLCRRFTDGKRRVDAAKELGILVPVVIIITVTLELPSMKL